jgi:hypothetical protein
MALFSLSGPAIFQLGFDGKLVKGAPYSAQAITETTQTLADGNRIVNKSSAMLYRDSEGRTRREQTLKAIGSFAVDGPLQTIIISDPVAGVSYVLDSKEHVAHKMPNLRYELGPVTGAPLVGAPPGQMGVRVHTGPGGETSVAVNGAAGFGLKQDGVHAFALKPAGAAANAVTEPLGVQTIEGVDAEGTRTTITIPAGAIGNEKPIEIVEERWYSPSLQTVIMTRHSDPRFGETSYRLTNIDREEPARTLFELPADYQVEEGPPAPIRSHMRKPE